MLLNANEPAKTSLKCVWKDENLFLHFLVKQWSLLARLRSQLPWPKFLSTKVY